MMRDPNADPGGRPPLFSTPQDLMRECLDYIDWCEENPNFESHLASYQGKHELISVPKMQITSLFGLCGFLGISIKTWYSYKEKPEFLPYMERAENMLNAIKISGAASGLLNANLVARLVGLSDKLDTKVDSDSAITIKKITREIIKPE